MADVLELPVKIPNLGIAFSCAGDPKLLIDSAKRAEQAGFSGVWLVEVFDIDTLAMAAALAQATRRINIATGVVNSNLRLPTLLAMSATTLSMLSDGRFILGIGAGSAPMSLTSKVMFNTSLTRLSETLQIVRGCLNGKKFYFSGKLFDVKGFQLGISSKFNIPVYCAAMGLKAVEIAAKYADGVILMLPTLDHARAAVQRIDATLMQRGLSPHSFPVACHLVTVISNNPEEAVSYAKRFVAQFAWIPAYHENFVRLGFVDEMALIDQALAHGGVDEAMKIVPTEMAEKTVVYGNAEECAKKISNFVRVGISRPIVYPSTSGPLPYPRRINESVDLFTPFLEKQ